MFILFQAQGFEFWELQTPFYGVQENNVVSLGVGVQENTPNGQRGEVGTVVCLGSGVQRHDNILHRRRVLLRPEHPPLALDDRSLFGGRILLILCVPLVCGHGRLGPKQRGQVKKLWPERFLHDGDVTLVVFLLYFKYGRVLHDLVLVGPFVIYHILC